MCTSYGQKLFKRDTSFDTISFSMKLGIGTPLSFGFLVVESEFEYS